MINQIKTISERVSNKVIVPNGMKGLGDIVALVAQPIAKLSDGIIGTGLANCSGCKRRQENLNEMFPFASDETISLADKPDT